MLHLEGNIVSTAMSEFIGDHMLSVLITTRNHADVIKIALESCLDLVKEGIELEVIVGEDGSDENNKVKMIQVLALFDETLKIKYIRSKASGNIAIARNITLSHAHGKYVVVLDSDDALIGRGIAEQIKFLEENPQYEWCHAPVMVMDKDWNWKKFWLLSMPMSCAKDIIHWSDENGRLHPDVDVPDDLAVLNLEHSFVNNWGCVMRRSLLESVRGWSEDMPGNGCGEDYDLNMKLLIWTPPKWLPYISYKFRQDERASTQKWDFSPSGKYLGPFSNYEYIRAKFRPVIEGHKNVKILLDIGCGGKVKHNGYKVTTLDSRGEVNPDIFQDAGSLIPLPDVLYDKVYASHVLEHFPRARASEILRNWLRVLKIGGEIEIRVPDILTLATNIIDEEVTEHDLHCQLFGAHTNVYDEHHAYYTEKSLTTLMSALGCGRFECDRDLSQGPNLTWRGTKIREVPHEEVQSWFIELVVPSKVYIDDTSVPVTVNFKDEAKGSELVIEFLDYAENHYFRWVCTMDGGIYNASLYLTDDIRAVLGLWKVLVWCNGVRVHTQDFKLLKERNKINEALEDYKARG